MRAIQITSLAGPEAVELHDIPAPVPSREAGEVLINVFAAGVAFPELLQTRGQYQVRPDLPFVPGAEVAGTVEVAPAGSKLRPGDRVAALTAGGLGGFAEQALAHEHMVFPLPEGVDFRAAAGFVFNYFTSHFALLIRGQLQRDETVLVHGAAGGIGTSAIQIARAFGAGRIIGVASTEQKRELALAAGADEAIGPEDFLGSIGRNSVDVVVDPVGGDRFTDSLRALKPFGRHLVIGFTGGQIPAVKVNRLLLNNISTVGVGWGAYFTTHPQVLAEQWEQLRPHLASGALTPIIGQSFDLEEASQALLALENRAALGKIVLTTD